MCSFSMPPKKAPPDKPSGQRPITAFFSIASATPSSSLMDTDYSPVEQSTVVDLAEPPLPGLIPPGPLLVQDTASIDVDVGTPISGARSSNIFTSSVSTHKKASAKRFVTNKAKKGRGPAEHPFVVVPGSLKTNLIRAWRKECCQHRFAVDKQSNNKRMQALQRGCNKQLPSHLRRLMKTIEDAHERMVIINYRAHLFANVALTSFIDARLPIPSLDLKFALSCLNDVSCQDRPNEVFTLVVPPYLQHTNYPLILWFKCLRTHWRRCRLR